MAKEPSNETGKIRVRTGAKIRFRKRNAPVLIRSPDKIKKGSKEGRTEVYQRVRPSVQPCAGMVSMFCKIPPYDVVIHYNVWGRP